MHSVSNVESGVTLALIDVDVDPIDALGTASPPRFQVTIPRLPLALLPGGQTILSRVFPPSEQLTALTPT